MSEAEEKELREEQKIETTLDWIKDDMASRTFEKRLMMGKESQEVAISTAALLSDKKVIFFSDNYDAVVYDDVKEEVVAKNIFVPQKED